jgi:uncharacterized phage protein (TIGR02218 family)
MSALYAHLALGVTTVCRAWVVTRRDGVVFGFTDHDLPLVVEGVTCRADSGMTARALQQTTGLSVDNSEAVGALSDAAITEGDLIAGRFDGAEVRSFLVNWAAPEERVELFRGSLGEITRGGGAFSAELRGLSEALNQPQGFAYLPRCSAVLGDSRCGVDLATPGFRVEIAVDRVEERQRFDFAAFPVFEERWFQDGTVEVLTGAAAGLSAVIKTDRRSGDGRQIDLWQSLGAEVAPGDFLRISAGCDKAAATCRVKFGNFLNFRGFPHVPGEDWLASYPVADRPNTGGSRGRA